MRFARFALMLTATGFLAFGVRLLLAPGAIAGMGLEPTSAAALTEVRGFYGGLEIGLGAFLGCCAWSSARTMRQSGLLAGALVLGALAGARLVGFAVDRAPTAALVGFAALEAFGALLNAAAWRRLRRMGTSARET